MYYNLTYRVDAITLQWTSLVPSPFSLPTAKRVWSPTSKFLTLRCNDHTHDQSYVTRFIFSTANFHTNTRASSWLRAIHVYHCKIMASLLWSRCYICSQTVIPGCGRHLISTSVRCFLNLWLQLEEAAFCAGTAFLCVSKADHMAAAHAIFEDIWLTINRSGLQRTDCGGAGNSHEAATQNDFVYLLDSGSSPHSVQVVSQDLTPGRLRG